jgi:hypothetical protein
MERHRHRRRHPHALEKDQALRGEDNHLRFRQDRGNVQDVDPMAMVRHKDLHLEDAVDRVDGVVLADEAVREEVDREQQCPRCPLNCFVMTKFPAS